MSEVPFPQPMDAILTRPPVGDAIGWLTFIDPKGNHRTSVPVTNGPTGHRDKLGNVWHIDLHDDGTATTSPSIHAVGSWHTPYTCRWRIVDQLPDELVPCPVCGREPGETHDGDVHLAQATA